MGFIFHPPGGKYKLYSLKHTEYISRHCAKEMQGRVRGGEFQDGV